MADGGQSMEERLDAMSTAMALGVVEEWSQLGMQLLEAYTRMSRSRESPSVLGEGLCNMAENGRLDEVRRFLDAGVDVNYTSVEGYTPLISACLFTFSCPEPNPDVVSLLLARGADVLAVGADGMSVLHPAALHDPSARSVVLLINAGARVDARDRHGGTPLHYAAIHNNQVAVSALLTAGADKTLRGWSDDFKNKTPFDVAKSDAVRDLLRQ